MARQDSHGRLSLQMAGIFLLKTCFAFMFLSEGSRATRLYTEDDPVVILTSSTLSQSVYNSSTAWLVQFYSSWCGHCIQYSPTWKALAGDVKEWEQAIRLGVVDCAHENNFDICKEFGIHFYPTFRYFKAHAMTQFGTTYRGADRELQTVRQLMVDILQNHTRTDWPEHCPPLDPLSSADIVSLLGQRSDHYTAIIVENQDSYVGREVILDLMTYQGVTVRRALSSNSGLVEKLGVNTFPSVYLLHPNGTHTVLDFQKRLRFFFSSFLRLLPGVQRQSGAIRGPGSVLQGGAGGQHTDQPWRDFDSSKVYMADLEAGLHYLMRVELATHRTLEGEDLSTFKDFVTVVAKLFPGRQCVVKLLETLLEWLVSLPLDKIPYDAILDLVNNKMRISGLFLGEQLQWVGCQGTRAGLRGYPCSLWTLFHVLTVQAAVRPDALANTGLEDNPRAVLQTMRRYIVRFFGCQECGQHFDHMAQESLSTVESGDQSVLWLWSRHNQVNNRLAGSMSEDPKFPKSQWPSPSLCPSCHEERSGLHVWSEEQVLSFLKQHYGEDNISLKYTLTPIPPSDPRPDKVPERPYPPQPPQPIQEGVAESQTVPPNDFISQVSQPRKSEEEVRLGVSSGTGILILGFSSVDMSLCVLLYACSCLFLMLMFFFFRVRSKRWKVHHKRPYV